MSGHGFREIGGIRWSLGETGYQFIGTGPYRYQSFVDDSTTFLRYLPLVYAVNATFDKKFKAVPLVSSAEMPPSDEWMHDPDPRNTNDYLNVAPAHQPDGHGVHPFHIRSVGKKRKPMPWMISQWAQSWPCHALTRFSGSSTPAPRWASVDVGFDYPPVVFDKKKGKLKRFASDWWQRGCLRKVENRTFVIVADVDSTFYCFPTGSETGGGESENNIPPDVIKSDECPWPSWVNLEPLGVDEDLSDQISRIRPRWEFCGDGTRAACIVARRESPWSDATYTSSAYSSSGTLLNEIREDYPGMVEVSFSIDITGPDPEDFDFSVSIGQSIYCVDSGRYPIAVGYAMKNMTGVSTNDLLLLEYEFYTSNIACSVDHPISVSALSPPVDPEGGWKIPQRPAFSAIAKISKQSVVGGSFSEVRRWLAYYAVFPTERTVGYYQEPRPFYPLLEDIPDVPFDETWYDNNFSFIAHVNSVDLSACAVSLSATISTLGATPRSGGNTYGCEVNLNRVIVWNEIKTERAIGYPFLKPIVASYLDLTSDYHDIENSDRIYPGATLDYLYYGTASVGTKTCDAATLTVRDGHPTDERTVSSTLGRAYFNGSIQSGVAEFPLTVSYSNITNCPLFSGHARVYYPAIYSFFDGYANVRPGMRWTKTSFGEWEPGNPSFSGYPYGIVMASRIFGQTCATLATAPDRAIHAHPSGSWSIFSGPFACQKNVVNYSEEIPDNFEQCVIDVVRFDDSDRKTTTHVALVNEAFGKTLYEEDFHFKFRKIGIIPEFEMMASYPSPIGWQLTMGFPIGVAMSGEDILGMFPFFFSCFDNEFLNLSNGGFGVPIHIALPTPRLESLFY